MPTKLMPIGEAAKRLGVSTHLLRHWEAEGVVLPHRTQSGARRYDDAQLEELVVGIECQRAGRSLSAIAQLIKGTRLDRRRLVAEQRESLNRHRERLGETITFLDHVLECSHPVVRECPACHDFVSSG